MPAPDSMACLSAVPAYKEPDDLADFDDLRLDLSCLALADDTRPLVAAARRLHKCAHRCG